MSKNLYAALDKYLATPTWDSNQERDREAFFHSIEVIIREDEFNPDQMADYIRTQKGLKANDRDSAVALFIEGLKRDAWAAFDYLRYNGQL